MNKITFFVALFFCVGIWGCEGDDTPQQKGKSDAIFNPNLTYGSMTDIDGNEYKTIKIGKQTWMAQNLRVTHYRNGDPINYDADSLTNWNEVKVGTYCTPLCTKNLDTIATYGLLYNGYAITDKRNIAPKGWRVPSKEDVEELWEYLETLRTPEDRIRSGGRLKEVGTKHWSAPNIATNSSGFTLLPTRVRSRNGFIATYPNTGSCTTKTIVNSVLLFGLFTCSEHDLKGIGGWGLVQGSTVRCIKEN